MRRMFHGAGNTKTKKKRIDFNTVKKWAKAMFDHQRKREIDVHGIRQQLFKYS